MSRTPSRLFAVALSSILVWLAGPHGADAGVNVWTTNGPVATRILALAIDPESPTTIYAGAESGGVFKSTDGGGGWANTGLTGVDVRALVIDPLTPTTVYAGTSGAGVFKSSDGGTSWIAVNTGLPDGYVRALAIDPQTPTILYVSISSYPRRLFKSTDGGTSWSASDDGLYDDIYVDALAIDPLTPTTLYAGTHGSGVFKSIDAGGRWIGSHAPAPFVLVQAIDPVTP